MSEVIDQLTKQAADKGKLIELGWLSLWAMSLQGASEVQVAEMRKAFFAGAQHLYGSIMSMLDPGPNETEADLSRMALIDSELRDFIKELKE